MSCEHLGRVTYSRVRREIPPFVIDYFDFGIFLKQPYVASVLLEPLLGRSSLLIQGKG